MLQNGIGIYFKMIANTPTKDGTWMMQLMANELTDCFE